MVSTGIVRKIDDIRRIVLPKDVRAALEMEEGTRLTISIFSGYIILRKENISHQNESGYLQKATRKLDELGRIALPKQFMARLSVEERNPLEIFIGDDFVALKKYGNPCVFCGVEQDTKIYRKKPICCSCREEVAYVH